MADVLYWMMFLSAVFMCGIVFGAYLDTRQTDETVLNALRQWLSTLRR